MRKMAAALANRIVVLVCPVLAGVVSGCDSGPVYDPTDYAAHHEPEAFVSHEWKPIDGDKPSMAKLGQEAMDTLGYEEIIKRAEKLGWIKTVRVEQAQLPGGKMFIAQGAAVVAEGELVKLFTKYAVWAGISSQADSPVPGPGDAIAVGIIVVGLIHVGALATQELLAEHVQISTTSATPTATTTTTSPPIAVPRRWPGQTCEDAELDRLQNEKGRICNLKRGYAVNCNPKNKGLDEIPCSIVKLSLQQRYACKAARWAVQEKCFGGKPDDRHEKPLDETQGGIDNCELLKLKVCAKGHPMANL